MAALFIRQKPPNAERVAWWPGGRHSEYTIFSPASSRSTPDRAMSTEASAACHEPSAKGDDVSKQNQPRRPYALVAGTWPTGIASTRPGWMNISAITAWASGRAAVYSFHAVDKKSRRSG